MTIAVVGAAGFVGLNLVETLLTRGRDVRAIDRAPLPERARTVFADLPGRLEITHADVTDGAAIAEALGPGIEAVIYGAAITAGAARDAEDPDAILAVNLGGLVPVLRAARAASARRLVLLSSVAALGDAVFRAEVLDETAPADPVSLYSITKLASERVAFRLGDLWKVDVRAVRFTSVFGPWERATGVRDSLSPHFQIMSALARGEPALLPPGGTRDWIYAPDAAEAAVAVLDAAAPRHRLYNVSPGVASSLHDWASRLAALRPDAVCRPAGPGEASTIEVFPPHDRGILSPERIRADLGWSARFRPEDTPTLLDAWWRANVEDGS